MADHVSREKRSTIMAAVRAKDTGPELAVRRAAHRLGLRFRLSGRRLPGRPDMVFPRWRTALFVNGCFWHRHAGCRKATMPKSNTAFWKAKFRKNVRRDRQNHRQLTALGWRVVVLWQCEVSDADQLAALLRAHFRLGHHAPRVSADPEPARPMGIDLFAGCGGLSLGFEQAGFDVLAAVDSDAINAATYKYNFPFTEVLQSEIAAVAAHDVLTAARRGHRLHDRQDRFRRRIDVVFGGPPCQGFSLGGRRDPTDSRNLLVFQFARLVSEIRPRYFVMENVPGLLSPDNSDTVGRLLRRLRDAGYMIATPVHTLNAADFGVPQERRRSVLLGWLEGETPLMYPEPTCHPATRTSLNGRALDVGPTVADAIADLVDSDVLPLKKRLPRVATSYQRRLAGADPNNLSYGRAWSARTVTGLTSTKHSPAIIERFTATQPGCVDRISRFQRLSFAGISSTLRAGTGPERGSHTPPRPIHPTSPRVITAREAARLHSFPDWFGFHATKWHAWRQIGNSVPPFLARAIAHQVLLASGHTPGKPSRSFALGSPALLTLPGTAD